MKRRNDTLRVLAALLALLLTATLCSCGTADTVTPELLKDSDTLTEMLTFVRNSSGRAEAKAGAHDDLVMALAIAHRIREQQSRIIKDDPKAIKFDFFGEEQQKKKEREIGEEVRVI